MLILWEADQMRHFCTLLLDCDQKYMIFSVMTYTPLSFFVREINELEGNEEEDKENEEEEEDEEEEEEEEVTLR